MIFWTIFKVLVWIIYLHCCNPAQQWKLYPLSFPNVEYGDVIELMVCVWCSVTTTFPWRDFAFFNLKTKLFFTGMSAGYRAT